ncbi:hypothetical protein Q3G72_008776 [Acer saccharum]|nr:hypothetical protein Q3G72_008776 [Acer saccharum]
MTPRLPFPMTPIWLDHHRRRRTSPPSTLEEQIGCSIGLAFMENRKKKEWITLHLRWMERLSIVDGDPSTVNSIVVDISIHNGSIAVEVFICDGISSQMALS